MGKLKSFAITLDSLQPVFYPNQILTGNVTLELSEPMEMRGIRIKFEGKGYCHWTEEKETGSGDDRRTETVHYSGSETIVKIKTVLHGHPSSAPSSSKFLLPAGYYSYPFNFTLPGQLPSSFEGDIGHIRYILKANIDKPWKFDHKVKRPITINDIIDPNLPMYAEGRGGERHKNVGCLCCAAGPLEMSANIDRSCFCPGEAILINALIQNQTTRDMTSMYAKLIQTVTYHASDKDKSKAKEVARVTGPMIPKHEDASWINQPLGIPAVPPTIMNSTVITVHYKVKICVAVPWGMNPEIKLHITMGTVPFIKVYGQPVQHGSAQEQQVPRSDLGPEYPPPIPSDFGYPDMPPPSYSAAVGQSGVHIGGNKDEYTYGNLQYNPVYTFAQPYQNTYNAGPSAPAPEYGGNPPPYSLLDHK